MYLLQLIIPENGLRKEDHSPSVSNYYYPAILSVIANHKPLVLVVMISSSSQEHQLYINLNVLKLLEDLHVNSYVWIYFKSIFSYFGG